MAMRYPIIVMLALFLVACSDASTEAVGSETDVAGSEILVPLDSTEASSMSFDEIEQRWPGDETALGVDYQESLGITLPLVEEVTVSEAQAIINRLVNDYYELTESGHRRDMGLMHLQVTGLV